MSRRTGRPWLLAALPTPAIAGGAPSPPLAALLRGLRSADIGAQVGAAGEIKARGLLAAPGVQAAYGDAIERDSQARRTPAGAGDAYSEPFGRMMVGYRNAYGLKPASVARAMLESADFQPQSQLSYWLGQLGAPLFENALAMARGKDSWRSSVAIGVLAAMLVSQRKGEISAPLTPAKQSAAKSAIYAMLPPTATRDSLGLGMSTFWVLSQLRDAGALPILERLGAQAAAAGVPKGSARSTVWSAVAVIRFAKASPKTAAQAEKLIVRFDSPSWEARATAFYTLGAAASDMFYGWHTPEFERKFPRLSGRIGPALAALLSRETALLSGSPKARQDQLLLRYYDSLANAAAGSQGPDATRALVGALPYAWLALLALAERGTAALPLLLRYFRGSSGAGRQNAIKAMVMMASEAPAAGPGLRAPFEALLRSTLVSDRLQGLKGVDMLRDTSERPLLKKMQTSDPSPAVRTAAAKVLADPYFNYVPPQGRI